uniref:Uncharacterized protein n=1 Tax=Arundo donax TaxID=35708 RepID=A0A0A9A0L5_ARUDO
MFLGGLYNIISLLHMT